MASSALATNSRMVSESVTSMSASFEDNAVFVAIIDDVAFGRARSSGSRPRSTPDDDAGDVNSPDIACTGAMASSIDILFARSSASSGADRVNASALVNALAIKLNARCACLSASVALALTLAADSARIRSDLRANVAVSFNLRRSSDALRSASAAAARASMALPCANAAVRASSFNFTSVSLWCLGSMGCKHRSHVPTPVCSCGWLPLLAAPTPANMPTAACACMPNAPALASLACKSLKMSFKRSISRSMATNLPSSSVSFLSKRAAAPSASRRAPSSARSASRDADSSDIRALYNRLT
mmetsp:Transcript_4264/g.15616  ORF Transcript_4264/g.15616 Transcript_4264/m.15616 type:complete len:301 (-) Transcript_4264:2178-3080(-)